MCPYIFLVWLVILLYTFNIKIGNLTANVQSNYSYVAKVCAPYYTDAQPDFCLTLDDASFEKERAEALRINNDLGTSVVNTEDSFLEVYDLLNKLLPYLPAYDMLFMHGSAIKFADKAYIFVAPSGTGKSTHTRLWKERYGDAVTVINDDKPFLLFREEEVQVCGTPWRGKHCIGENTSAVLSGICILSQGKENVMERVKASDAVKDIILQSNIQTYKENTILALDLVDKLLHLVPVYRLSCTPTQEAVEVCANMIIK